MLRPRNLCKFLLAPILCLAVFSSCIHQEPRPDRESLLPHTPKRVMILVFDQMRPDFVDRFDLKHFKWLAENGVSFPQAYVGDLGSITVVSHAVITSGKL